MIQSDKLRRFSSPAVEIKNGVRNELQREIDEWLAAGNKIQIARPLEIKPKPIMERVAINKKPVKRQILSTRVWDDDNEIQAIRYMKALGHSNQMVLEAINKCFGRNRQLTALKSLCSRLDITVNIASRYAEHNTGIDYSRGNSKYSYHPNEDAILLRMAKEGATSREIAEALTNIRPEMYRTSRSVKQRAVLLGIYVRQEGK